MSIFGLKSRHKNRPGDVRERIDDPRWQAYSDETLHYFQTLGGADEEAATKILASRQVEKNQRDQASSAYQNALEKATYTQLGPRFSQGLQQIQGRLAGLGPLADSGAATGLKARLGSGFYNTAAGNIAGSQANFLQRYIEAQQQYKYQTALLKQQKDQNKKGFWQIAAPILAGAGGAVLGGPNGAVAGYSIGTQATNDSYSGQ